MVPELALVSSCRANSSDIACGSGLVTPLILLVQSEVSSFALCVFALGLKLNSPSKAHRAVAAETGATV